MTPCELQTDLGEVDIRQPKYKLGAIVWFDNAIEVVRSRICGVTVNAALYSVDDQASRAKFRITYDLCFPDIDPRTKRPIWTNIRRDESGISATEEEAVNKLRKDKEDYNRRYGLNKPSNQQPVT